MARGQTVVRIVLLLGITVALVAVRVGLLGVGIGPDTPRLMVRRLLHWGPPHRERVEGTASLLPDGRVLLAGWQSLHGPKSAEVYDPAADRFVRAADMNVPRRHDPVSTVLADGRALVAGGWTERSERSDGIEAYDPIRNTWERIGRLPQQTRGLRRSGSAPDAGVPDVGDAVTLAGGAVLFTTNGGHKEGLLLFDPKSGVVDAVGHPAMDVGGTPLATLLPNGRVLITHLEYGSGKEDGASNAFLFDPQTRETAPLPRMAQRRHQHQATLMSDGRVLVTGGNDGEPSAEIFDPASGTFVPAGEMAAPRALHRAVGLADGRVLVVGGVSVVPYDERPPLEIGSIHGKSLETLETEARKLVDSRPAAPKSGPLACAAEIYDPQTNRFTPLPPPPSLIENAHGGRTGLHLLMPSGEVLFLSREGAVYFKPATNSWHFTSSWRYP